MELCCGYQNKSKSAATEPYIHWWQKPAITYRFYEIPKGLTAATFTQALNEAFAKWMKYIPLKVTQATPSVVVPELHFHTSDLSYAQPGTIALSVVPDNYAKFTETWINQDISWTYPSPLLSFMLCHEIGHQLGLEHSALYNAIMWYAWTGTVEPQQNDDVTRMVEMYGVNPDLPTWTKVADQGGSFRLAGPTTVRYGADSRWVQKDLAAGSYTCDVPLFGTDPAYGTLKTCQVSGKVPPEPVPVTPTVSVVTTGEVRVVVNGKVM